MTTRLHFLAAVLILAGSAGLAAQTGTPASSPAELTAAVDPRVELMSIIFRLAGNPEYNQPNSQSPYADDARTHFGPQAGHAVVQTARRLRNERGVSYDAVMSMAVHLTDATTLQERVPFEQKPPKLDERWTVEDARRFLAEARDFVRQTGFAEFVRAHEPLYAAAARRMEALLRKREYLPWFDKYFGVRAGAEFRVLIGMLNGGACYGVSFRDGRGHEEITPIIGVHQFDADGTPEFDDRLAPTIVHEFCHSYTNDFVNKHADELQAAGQRIFAGCEAVMRQQAYGEWKTLMYESLVRVCVVRYLNATDGPDAARQAIQREHDRGFVWIGDLSKLLEDYEGQRQRYPAFDAFMPRIVAFFDDYANRHQQQAAAAPQVVSMNPRNGANDVDPNLAEITVTFDQPMTDGNWSVVGGGPQFPEITGQIHYDAEGKVLTIPVRLKPDWSYEFWLNRGQYNSFQSRQGVRLEPVHVQFRTQASALSGGPSRCGP